MVHISFCLDGLFIKHIRFTDSTIFIRFSLLESAARFVPEASAGDEILLQGVVDCFFEEDGALVVVDFKTDRIAPDALAERAEHYRPQLEAYSLALAQVIGKPVKEKILYFLRRGEQIIL